MTEVNLRQLGETGNVLAAILKMLHSGSHDVSTDVNCSERQAPLLLIVWVPRWQTLVKMNQPRAPSWQVHIKHGFSVDELFGVDFIQQTAYPIWAPWQNVTVMIGFVSVILLTDVELKPGGNTIFWVCLCKCIVIAINHSISYLTSIWWTNQFRNGHKTIYTQRHRTLLGLFIFWWWRHNQLCDASDDLTIDFAAHNVT